MIEPHRVEPAPPSPPIHTPARPPTSGTAARESESQGGGGAVVEDPANNYGIPWIIADLNGGSRAAIRGPDSDVKAGFHLKPTSGAGS